jgi:hypothetical protein
MQHDTLPHDVHLGGTVRRVQAASLVLAYSRMLFFQFYPQFHRDRPGEQIERLALHALRGELQGKAVSYLRQGGGKAAARSSLSEARGWLEQALGILDTLPASPSTLEQGFDIRLELRSVLSAFGEVRRAWSGRAKPRPSPSD